MRRVGADPHRTGLAKGKHPKRPIQDISSDGYTVDWKDAESDIEALGRRRRYDFRPAKTEVPVKKPKAEWLKAWPTPR